jgi:hypothetical protein
MSLLICRPTRARCRPGDRHRQVRSVDEVLPSRAGGLRLARFLLPARGGLRGWLQRRPLPGRRRGGAGDRLGPAKRLSGPLLRLSARDPCRGGCRPRRGPPDAGRPHMFPGLARFGDWRTSFGPPRRRRGRPPFRSLPERSTAHKARWPAPQTCPPFHVKPRRHGTSENTKPRTHERPGPSPPSHSRHNRRLKGSKDRPDPGGQDT